MIVLTWLNMQAAGPRPCQPAGGCAGRRAATPARAEVCGLRLQACQGCQTHEVPGCLVMFQSADQLSEYPADGATGSVCGGHFKCLQQCRIQAEGTMKGHDDDVTHGKLRAGAAMHPMMLPWPLLSSAVLDLGSAADSAAFSWDPCAGACDSAWLLHWQKILIGPTADPIRAKHCRFGMITTLHCALRIDLTLRHMQALSAAQSGPARQPPPCSPGARSCRGSWFSRPPGSRSPRLCAGLWPHAGFR